MDSSTFVDHFPVMEELDIGVRCPASVLDREVMACLEVDDHGVEGDGAGGHDGDILCAVVTLSSPATE